MVLNPLFTYVWPIRLKKEYMSLTNKRDRICSSVEKFDAISITYQISYDNFRIQENMHKVVKD